MANLSTFTSVPLIAERSEATPGLWNNIFSVISQNVDQLNADTSNLSSSVGTTQNIIGFSSNTLRSQSGNTLSLLPYSTAIIGKSIDSGGALYNILAYGAVGDGTLVGGTGTDNLTALTNAITNSPDGAAIYVPPGIFNISSTITVTKGLTLLGAGRGRSVIQLSNATRVGLAIQADGPFLIRDIMFSSSATSQTGGAAISVQGTNVGTSVNQNSFLENVEFRGQWIGVDFIDAALWHMVACTFNSVQSVGVRVNNTVTADQGDSRIVACTFGGAQPSVLSSTAILQYASGGLTVLGSKFENYTYCYHLSLSSGAGLTNFQFTGNNCEPIAAVGVGNVLLFDRQNANDANAFISKVCITGNGFNTNSSVTQVLFNSAARSGAIPSISGVQIAGNVFQLGSLGSGTAISIQSSGMDACSIIGNVITGNSGSQVGISVDSRSSTVQISGNIYRNIPTRYNYTAATGPSGNLQWFEAVNPVSSQSGSAAIPAYTFVSETSLGFFSSGASIIQQSYGTFAGSNLSLTGNAVITGNASVTGTGTYNGVLLTAQNNTDAALAVQSTAANGRRYHIVATGSASGNVNQGLYLYDVTGAFKVWSILSDGQFSFGSDGKATAPILTFDSDQSLGLYRSGVQTVAQSYGTFNLASNAVRLSMRTLAASAVTASAAKTNVAVNEVVFTVGGASGASLCISSGGTTYIFNSVSSAANN